MWNLSLIILLPCINRELLNLSVYISVYHVMHWRSCKYAILPRWSPSVLTHQATPLESRLKLTMHSAASRCCAHARWSERHATAAVDLIGRGVLRGAVAATNYARSWRKRLVGRVKRHYEQWGLLSRIDITTPSRACGSVGLLKWTRDRRYTHETLAGRKDVRPESSSSQNRLSTDSVAISRRKAASCRPDVCRYKMNGNSFVDSTTIFANAKGKKSYSDMVV